MPQPLRGRELAYATLDYIKSHPEEWEQTEWRCESGMCFAGHAAILGGAVWVKQNLNDTDWKSALFMIYKGKVKTVDVLAAEFLEINTDPLRFDLFDSENTIEDIEKFLEDCYP